MRRISRSAGTHDPRYAGKTDNGDRADGIEERLDIKTAKVADRRTLRFETLAEMHRDLDVLERAHELGTLRRTGNWTEGETFTHLAAFINYGYDGYPKEVSPPWLLAVLFIRPRRAKYLNVGFPAGVKIPGTKKGTIGMEDVPFEVGVATLRGALEKLERVEPPLHSPAFGKMTHEEKIRMGLRHGELHLSFLHPR